jgi:hypothetical protein
MRCTKLPSSQRLISCDQVKMHIFKQDGVTTITTGKIGKRLSLP